MIPYFLICLLAARQSSAQVRLLFQNDLTSVPLSALLVSDPTSGNSISSVCSRYNEQPLTNVTSDIHDQLNYLVFRGDLTNSSRLYIAPSSGALRFKRQSSCSAYNIGSAAVESVDCTSEYVCLLVSGYKQTLTDSQPILCTNSPGPINIFNQSAVAPGSEITTQGANGSSFTGFRDARSFRFLGIPFAAPPVGDLRFEPAQPYTEAYSNFSATSFGKSCVQPGGLFGIANQSSTDEDCLTLNVYTPLIAGNSQINRSLPVAVWIYGGAFTTGNSSIIIYEGQMMASRGDVVVVTINYRLGLLGLLASNSLNGSQLITDQIMALKFVQNHIAAFGGDPTKVTIFGESAGAQSVLALLSSTPAKGLFRAAIAESAPWAPLPDRKVYADYIYPTLLNATNCGGSSAADQLACLRKVPQYEFVDPLLTGSITQAAADAFAAFDGATAASGAEPLLPVVGTGIVDGQFLDLVNNGQLPSASIPVMIGNNRDEGLLFVDAVLTTPLPNSQDTLTSLLGVALNNATYAAITSNANLFSVNSSDSDGVRNELAKIITYTQWQCPTQQALSAAHDKGTFSSLYTFVFDKGFYLLGQPPACSDGGNTVCHSAEIVEVFGTAALVGLPFFEPTNPLSFAQYVNDIWTSFVRTGSPTIDADYVAARGSAYSSSLALAQSTPFNTYNPNSSTIHLFDTVPSNTGPLYVDQCSVLQSSLAINTINSSFSTGQSTLSSATRQKLQKAASLW